MIDLSEWFPEPGDIPSVNGFRPLEFDEVIADGDYVITAKGEIDEVEESIGFIAIQRLRDRGQIFRMDNPAIQWGWFYRKCPRKLTGNPHYSKPLPLP